MKLQWLWLFYAFMVIRITLLCCFTIYTLIWNGFGYFSVDNKLFYLLISIYSSSTFLCYIIKRVENSKKSCNVTDEFLAKIRFLHAKTKTSRHNCFKIFKLINNFFLNNQVVVGSFIFHLRYFCLINVEKWLRYWENFDVPTKSFRTMKFPLYL